MASRSVAPLMQQIADVVTVNGTTRGVAVDQTGAPQERAKVKAKVKRALHQEEKAALKDLPVVIGRGAGVEATEEVDITEDPTVDPQEIRKMVMLPVVADLQEDFSAETSVAVEAEEDHDLKTARAKLESRSVRMDPVDHHAHATAGVVHLVHAAETLNQNLEINNRTPTRLQKPLHLLRLKKVNQCRTQPQKAVLKRYRAQVHHFYNRNMLTTFSA